MWDSSGHGVPVPRQHGDEPHRGSYASSPASPVGCSISPSPSRKSSGAATGRDRPARVRVTYAAAAYVFGGSTLLIAGLWIDALDPAKLTIAKDVFMMVLPVATGIITYWFASRKPPEAAEKDDAQTPNAPGAAASGENKGKADDDGDGTVETEHGDAEVVDLCSAQHNE